MDIHSNLQFQQRARDRHQFSSTLPILLDVVPNQATTSLEVTLGLLAILRRCSSCLGTDEEWFTLLSNSNSGTAEKGGLGGL